MEETLNSDLEWKIGLYTPVDLGCSFKADDLINSGINLDSKISILKSNETTLPRKSILEDIGQILGEEDFENIISLCSKSDDERSVLDLFELNSKDGEDSDFVILKLKEGNDIFNKIKILHKGIALKYGVDSNEDYFPYITLAEVKKGAARKYTFSGNLKLILNDSFIDLEDFAIKTKNLDGSTKTYYLTHFKNLDRFFRLIHLQEDQDELFKDDIPDEELENYSLA